MRTCRSFEIWFEKSLSGLEQAEQSLQLHHYEPERPSRVSRVRQGGQQKKHSRPPKRKQLFRLGPGERIPRLRKPLKKSSKFSHRVAFCLARHVKLFLINRRGTIKLTIKIYCVRDGRIIKVQLWKTLWKVWTTQIR